MRWIWLFLAVVIILSPIAGLVMLLLSPLNLWIKAAGMGVLYPLIQGLAAVLADLLLDIYRRA